MYKIIFLIIVLILSIYFIFVKKNKEGFNVENANKRICICMSHTENIYPYSKLTENINRKYADKHGYEFKIFNLEMKDRAPQWCKIDVVNRLLDENQYDYLFWIDADAFVNKHDTPLETFITDETKSIIICDDIPNSGRENTLNSGTFFVKCNDWSKKFFKELWNYNGNYLYDHFHEQTMIEEYLKNDWMNAKEQIDVRPATEFNSDINQVYNGQTNDTFIIHLMGLPMDFRINYINDWMNRNNFNEVN